MISADAIAAQLFDEPSINLALARLAGKSGQIDRTALREAITNQPSLRRAVNRLMHPLIMDRIRQSGADFVEVPLLIEACLQLEFDRMWLVTCGPEEQLRRVTSRYGDVDKAKAIIRTQLPSRVKATYADVIIDTLQPIEKVKDTVKSALIHG